MSDAFDVNDLLDMADRNTVERVEQVLSSCSTVSIDDMVLHFGDSVCPNLMLRPATEDYELFCIKCKLHVKVADVTGDIPYLIQLLAENVENTPEPDAKPAYLDDEDEFFSRLG